MRKKLFYYSLAGFIFVAVFGSLLHFAYEWSGRNSIVGLFSPVNESVWEHIKLLFFPMLAFSLFAYYKLKQDYPCILSALCAGLLLGSLLIPILFYTYTGILGYHTLFADILVFLLSTAGAFLLVCRSALSCKAQKYLNPLILMVIAMLLCLFLFSYFPPDLSLFAEPSGD